MVKICFHSSISIEQQEQHMFSRKKNSNFCHAPRSFSIVCKHTEKQLIFHMCIITIHKWKQTMTECAQWQFCGRMQTVTLHQIYVAIFTTSSFENTWKNMRTNWTKTKKKKNEIFLWIYRRNHSPDITITAMANFLHWNFQHNGGK